MDLDDVGVVVATDADEDRVTVRVEEREVEVSLLLRPQVRVGDHVVVHSGLVIDVVTPEEAEAATALREAREQEEAEAARQNAGRGDPPPTALQVWEASRTPDTGDEARSGRVA